jgi:hypothetical protein
MRISSLFDLITDANDLLDLFNGVDSPEQLATRLDRLKRQGKDEMLACLEGLRGSVSMALNDTLEMNAAIDEPSDEDDFEGLDNLEGELAALVDENPIPAASPAAEDAKKDEPSNT